MTALATAREAVAIALNGRVAVNLTDATAPFARYPGVWFHSDVTSLPVIGTVDVAHYPYADATDINASGQVVGWGETPQERQVAILWRDGVPTVLPSPQQSRYNRAWAINADGDVVGAVDLSPSFSYSIFRAVLWRDGQVTELGTLGGTESQAFGINDLGQVVGGSFTSAGDFHAFRWEAGAMLDLGTLGGGFSSAYDISESGRIVGAAAATQPGTTRAVLWTAK